MTEPLSKQLEKANASIVELEEKIKTKDTLIASMYDEKLKLQITVKELTAKDVKNTETIEHTAEMLDKMTNIIAHISSENEHLIADLEFYKSIIQTMQGCLDCINQ